jgi:hypothetical protein
MEGPFNETYFVVAVDFRSNTRLKEWEAFFAGSDLRRMSSLEHLDSLSLDPTHI